MDKELAQQFSKNDVRRELNKLLPISYKGLIEGLTKDK